MTFTSKLLITVLVLFGCVAVGNAYLNPAPRAAPAVDTIDRVKPGLGPKNFAAAMAALDKRVLAAGQRADRQPGSWLNHEGLARAHLSRYRLSGNYDDLVRAGVAVQLGQDAAPKGSGPLLTRAIFQITTHQLNGLSGVLQQMQEFAVAPGADEQAEALAIAGDAEFFSGRYTGAMIRYNEAAAKQDGAGIAIRIGRLHQKTGRPDLAIASFVRAAKIEKSPTPQFLSSMLLQIGVIELERGKWDAASKYFAKADAMFPGFWLIQAHRAQMMAAKGDHAAAQKAYLQILADRPVAEVMDALAGIYRLEGKAAPSKAWAARAKAIWQQRLAALPDAAYGHAIDHELMLGDPKLALNLAQTNNVARPNGDSAILLAWALIANNQPAAARDILTVTNNTGWVSAQQHAALSQAYAMLGDSKLSSTEREAAAKLNPMIFDPAAPLIWFGHH
jgi:tetratricopeptide (TPR) repeat protein